jgi:hypothetical protein
MSPSIWGPPIWAFFHTIAEKIKDDKFNAISGDLFMYIKKICTVLPCPDCSNHATNFFRKINFAGVRNKNDFKNILYIFHNSVNKRKSKEMFKSHILSRYANENLINNYNRFVSVYKTKGNMKLIADSFQRQIILTEFKRWIITNISNFNM